MAGYVARRLAIMLLLIILLTLAVFFLFSILPADVARLSCGRPALRKSSRRIAFGSA